jgi:arylsulfatase A
MKLLQILLLFFFSSKVIQAQQRPNIIYIMCDDLGYLDLGCYGNPFNQTSNIDKLAKTGLKCSNAYSASTVCLPSRVAFMKEKQWQGQN